ncbi:exosome complex protein Rrp42 [Candidatus Woesearchaeota archaeon]|nr:exosome complex protein Rrp42 [Candidatus Woesearchaeota archaeon]
MSNNIAIFNDYLSKGIRFDGRRLDEIREVEVTTDVSKTAEGSAHVKIGDTEVMVGVKLGLGTPYPDTPNEGALMIGAEFSPLASPDFESGPPGIESIELSRVIDRGIRESKAIDNKKLCITKGEKVWMVLVDIVPLNDDGNLLDAAGLGTIAALKTTYFPEFDGVTVDYKKKTKNKLPLTKEPIPLTIYKIGDKLFVDPAIDEADYYDARLTVTSLEDGTICALQKGGIKPLTTEQIDEMVALALKKAPEFRKKIGGKK